MTPHGVSVVDIGSFTLVTDLPWTEAANWVFPILDQKLAEFILLRREKIYQKFKKLSRLCGIWTPTYQQPTDQKSGVLTITPQRQLWIEDTENRSVAFGYAWLVLVEFS